MFRRKTPRPPRPVDTSIRKPSTQCGLQFGSLFLVSLIVAGLIGSIIFHAELFATQFVLVLVIITALCHFRFGPLVPLACVCLYLFFRERQGAFNTSLTPAITALLALLQCGLMYRATNIVKSEATRPLLALRAFLATLKQPQPLAYTSVPAPLAWSVGSAAIACFAAIIILLCSPLTRNSIAQFRLQPTALRLIQLGFVLTFTFVLLRFFVQQFLWRRRSKAAARVFLVSTVAQWLHADTSMISHRANKIRRKKTAS